MKFFRAGANSHSPRLGTSPRCIGPCQIVPIAKALRGLACSLYTGAPGCRGSLPPGAPGSRGSPAAGPTVRCRSLSPSLALPDVPHRAASVPAFCQPRSPLRPGPQPPPGASTVPLSALPSAALPCSGTVSAQSRPVPSRPAAASEPGPAAGPRCCAASGASPRSLRPPPQLHCLRGGGRTKRLVPVPVRFHRATMPPCAATGGGRARASPRR